MVKVHMGILSLAFLAFAFSFALLTFEVAKTTFAEAFLFFPLSPPMSMGAGPCDDEAAPVSMCLD